jgi:hypothetical protein
MQADEHLQHLTQKWQAAALPLRTAEFYLDLEDPEIALQHSTALQQLISTGQGLLALHGGQFPAIEHDLYLLQLSWDMNHRPAPTDPAEIAIIEDLRAKIFTDAA